MYDEARAVVAEIIAEAAEFIRCARGNFAEFGTVEPATACEVPTTLAELDAADRACDALLARHDDGEDVFSAAEQLSRACEGARYGWGYAR